MTAIDLLPFRPLSGYRDVDFRVEFNQGMFGNAAELTQALGEAASAELRLRAKPSQAKLLMPLHFTTVSIQGIEAHEGTARGMISQRGMRILGVVGLVVCGLLIVAVAARTNSAVAEPWTTFAFGVLIYCVPLVSMLAVAGHVRGSIAQGLLDAFRDARSIESVVVPAS